MTTFLLTPSIFCFDMLFNGRVIFIYCLANDPATITYMYVHTYVNSVILSGATSLIKVLWMLVYYHRFFTTGIGLSYLLEWRMFAELLAVRKKDFRLNFQMKYMLTICESLNITPHYLLPISFAWSLLFVQEDVHALRINKFLPRRFPGIRAFCDVYNWERYWTFFSKQI